MIFAAILAGGKGTRMGSELPKQYLPLRGEPILLHTVRKFVTCPLIDASAVCVPRDYLTYTRELLAAMPEWEGKVAVIEGGADRTGSLENACRYLASLADGGKVGEDDVIVTHDCVRPFVTHAMIAASVDAAKRYGGATAAVPCVDTVCVSGDGAVIDDVPDRATLFSVQTPQTFLLREFLECLSALTPEERARVTDASAVLRLRGRRVALSAGSPDNIKITHPSDLAFAEQLI